MLIGLCSVDLVSRTLPSNRSVSSYIVVLPHWNNWGDGLVPLRSQADASYVTTDYQQGIFWNSAISFVGIWLLIAAGLWRAVREYVLTD